MSYQIFTSIFQNSSKNSSKSWPTIEKNVHLIGGEVKRVNEQKRRKQLTKNHKNQNDV